MEIGSMLISKHEFTEFIGRRIEKLLEVQFLSNLSKIIPSQKMMILSGHILEM